MKGRVLVTGGAGYIGSVIVDQLLGLGVGVVVLDDLSAGHQAAVARGAGFIQGGVGNRELVEAILGKEGIGAIVHMAAFALVAESVAQPQKYVSNNVTAARVLLEAAGRAKIRPLSSHHPARCTVIRRGFRSPRIRRRRP